MKIGYFSPVGAFGENAEPIEDLQYQDVVEGPLLLQGDKAIELIFTKYFKALVDYEGIQRTETYMLTRAVIRELLLNSVNHKDYATGVPIQVSYMKNESLYSIWELGQNVCPRTRGYMKNMNLCHIILKLQMCLFVQGMWRHEAEAF